MADELIPAEVTIIPPCPTIGPADDNPALVYLARLAPGSRRTMFDALNIVARMLSRGQSTDCTLFPWQALRYQHVAAVRSELLQQYSITTTRKILSAVRGVLKESWRLGYIDAETYHRAVDLEPIRGKREDAGRSLSGGEKRALFEVCANDTTAAGARDAAILAVGLVGGLRRSELVTVTVQDYDQDTGRLVIRSGKGRKDRSVYIDNGAYDALAAWLAVRGTADGPLFCPVSQTGVVDIRPMTNQVIRKMAVKRAKQAGIKNFSPHDLRYTFIGDLLDAGADIVTVQQLAGHASPATTARYDRRPEAARRKAAGLLFVPYVARKEVK